MLTLDNLQIFVFIKPYDYFHKDTFARQLLCDTWAMKLNGYLEYFPYGVLPIDHLDFISNHIVLCQKEMQTDFYRPLMTVKNLKLATCHEFDLDFPIYKHLFCKEREHYQSHIEAIEKWVESSSPENIAYSMGFTVEPNLSKEQKKELIELAWSFFYYFYTEYNIENVIHGVSKTFKLSEKSAAIGFKQLSLDGTQLSSIKTKSYNNVESEVMTLKLSDFNPFYQKKYACFQELWNQKICFAAENSNRNSIALKAV